jgi:uroporphyrinogen III methyltransferase/synthase
VTPESHRPHPFERWKVVVTRARSQSSGLVERLVEAGMEVIELPVIAIGDPVDGTFALQAAARSLASGHYGWAVLTSPNAASRLVSALTNLGTAPSSVKWAAVGTGTAAALSDAGIVVDLVATGSLAEALVDEFPRADPGASPVSRRVLFPRAETVRPVLADGLAGKGWDVDQVVAYRTVAGDPDPSAIERARGADAIAFSSSSTVGRSVALLGVDGIPRTVVTIGPLTSQAAHEAGLAVAQEASPHSIDGLVDAVMAALADRPAKRPERRRRDQQQQEQ